VTQPFVVTISHSLGKQEASRRLQDGLAEATRALADNKMVLTEYTWEENRAAFTVGVAGQTARGTIDVEDSQVRLEIYLPWMLSLIASHVQPYIEERGLALLAAK
jgi:hypothetical protein